ncbi:MAG: nucleotide sugar dehydrogenase [Eubacteriaceae bacterium]|nr:nucleotide sugar dehydrogenase [Eubacteriaceae bacterium]
MHPLTLEAGVSECQDLMKVSVIGLGYIGLPTAIVLAEAGHMVYGFDNNESIVDSLSEGHVHINEKGLGEMVLKALSNGSFKTSAQLMEAECYIISVPTPIHEENKAADLSYVYEAASSIGKVIQAGSLVVLESTVPPYSTYGVQQAIAGESGLACEDFCIAYCPERVLPGNIMHELRNNDRIVGSDTPEGAARARELYSSFLVDGKIYESTILTSEMCKLVENSFRDLNIAFANELSVICDSIGLDANELITLANRHPRVQILSPGVGVGGHCIPVDPWFLVQAFSGKAKLIRTAREVNDSKPAFVVEKVKAACGYDLSKRVAVLGLAYKPNVADLRESPSLAVARELLASGYHVLGVEPNVGESGRVSGVPLTSLEDALGQSDVIVLAVRHDDFFGKLANLGEGKTVLEF